MQNQPNHIDVYLLTTLTKEQYSLDDFTVLTAINRLLHTSLTKNDLDIFLEVDQPKTIHIVHALRDKGFAPGFISQYLAISKQSVSYHLGRPLPGPYTSYFLAKRVNEQNPNNVYSTQN